MSPADSIWLTAERAVMAGDVAALERLLREHVETFRNEPPQSSWLGGLAPNYSSADARSILTREHYFESFEELAEHLEALRRKDSAVAVFELAVDAVVAGDERTLKQLLHDHPELVHARSPRTHHATLLHYVGANGVESWRQATPPNAVQIAEALLAAGAEIDAMADMYGGSTTLGLVATSIHPLRAGVQGALMEQLLEHGAAMDHPGAAGNGHGIVNGCLANGRPEAAEFLASRGARLDLEGAAGVGRLEVVRTFFDEAGRLKPTASNDQLQSGLQWACEYGHTPIVKFLIERGTAVNRLHRGQTGLHWAAYGGHMEIVRLLLRQSAPVHLKDERFGSTPLGWALHAWASSPEAAGKARYHEVVAALVAAGATIGLTSVPRDKLDGDPRMAAALRGELPGN
jgi:ankyrin repeat protein